MVFCIMQILAVLANLCLHISLFSNAHYDEVLQSRMKCYRVGLSVKSLYLGLTTFVMFYREFLYFCVGKGVTTFYGESDSACQSISL